jgi:hypothetical protein
VISGGSFERMHAEQQDPPDDTIITASNQISRRNGWENEATVFRRSL